MDENLATLNTLLDTLVEFSVAYGFQIFGALVVLVIGLKVAQWLGNWTARMAEAKGLDATLSRFLANVVKLIVVVSVIIITLGNFGITIAPLIALAGAGAFGATMAIQGPLSNYGAGLSIILTRPFVIGDTVTVQKFSGVVEEISLAATTLRGEDGELILVPNKEIVGQILVNSERARVVESHIYLRDDTDVAKAISVVGAALAATPDVASEPAPQVGLHDFTYGGVILGLRFWIPSRRYYELRYTANQAALDALRAAGIEVLPATLGMLAAQYTERDA